MVVMDSILAEIVDFVQTQYGAHTVVLYGSRASCSDDADSDYDVAAFAPVEKTIRHNDNDNGDQWDLFVYPDAMLSNPTADLLKLRGGVVLLERDLSGQGFLVRMEGVYAEGPEAPAPDEVKVRHNWSLKMLARSCRPDVEGYYRRAWLMMTLLEDYFFVRQMWYQGPKKSFAWLKQQRAEDFALFEAALRPDASLEQMDQLIACVFFNHSAMR